MVDWKIIPTLLESGYIKRAKHPDLDLYIYNYTEKCQFERFWTEETLTCRGLIATGNNEVVSRPFRKFFTLEQHLQAGFPIPDMPFDVYEKLDGSLLISYYNPIEKKIQLASRGSFISDQAIWGNEILAGKKYDLDPEYTYCFELIHPQNKIVVDYNGEKNVILTGVFHTATGSEQNLARYADMGWDTVLRHSNVTDLDAVKSLERNNAEGVVVRYMDGTRIKIKWEDYLRLHRLVTNTTPQRVWECLKDGTPLDEMYKNVPDEFANWLSEVVTDLQNQYDEIISNCEGDFEIKESRKETAMHFQTCKYPTLMFMKLDNKDWKKKAWDYVLYDGRDKFRK